MRLKVGQHAPTFSVRDVSGRPVELAAYRGHTVLVSFYREAVCPLCNMRLVQLIQRYGEYQRRGLNCIAFFESSPARMHHYLDRLNAPFPLISDRGRVVYKGYGLESSLFGAFRALVGRRPVYREAKRLKVGGNIFANVFEENTHIGHLPGDFLIGPDGRIRLAYYGKDAGDFLLFSELDATLAPAAARV